MFAFFSFSFFEVESGRGRARPVQRWCRNLPGRIPVAVILGEHQRLLSSLQNFLFCFSVPHSCLCFRALDDYSTSTTDASLPASPPVERPSSEFFHHAPSTTHLTAVSSTDMPPYTEKLTSGRWRFNQQHASMRDVRYPPQSYRCAHKPTHKAVARISLPTKCVSRSEERLTRSTKIQTDAAGTGTRKKSGRTHTYSGV